MFLSSIVLTMRVDLIHSIEIKVEIEMKRSVRDFFRQVIVNLTMKSYSEICMASSVVVIIDVYLNFETKYVLDIELNTNPKAAKMDPTMVTLRQP